MPIKSTNIIIGSFNRGTVVHKVPEQNFIVTDACRVSEWESLLQEINALPKFEVNVEKDGVVIRTFTLSNFSMQIEKSCNVKDFNRFLVLGQLTEDPDSPDSIETYLNRSEFTDMEFVFNGDKDIKDSGYGMYRYKYSNITGAVIRLKTPKQKPKAPVGGEYKNAETLSSFSASRPSASVSETMGRLKQVQDTPAMIRRMIDVYKRMIIEEASEEEINDYYVLINSMTKHDYSRNLGHEISLKIGSLENRLFHSDASGLGIEIRCNEFNEYVKSPTASSPKTQIGIMTIYFFNGARIAHASFELNVVNMVEHNRRMPLGNIKTGTTSRRSILSRVEHKIREEIKIRFGRAIARAIDVKLEIRGELTNASLMAKELKTLGFMIDMAS